MTEVSYQINDTATTVLTTTGYCKYLVPEDKVQSTFTVKVTQYDKLKLFAIVDQEWGTSNTTTNVGPIWAVDQPQTHFVRMRQNDTYSISHEGNTITAAKKLEYDVSEYLPIAFRLGKLTAAQIIQI